MSSEPQLMAPGSGQEPPAPETGTGPAGPVGPAGSAGPEDLTGPTGAAGPAASETLEDYTLRFAPRSYRRWTPMVVATTALGGIAYLADFSIGSRHRLHPRHR